MTEPPRRPSARTEQDLYAALYAEMKQIAAAAMSPERADHTLQPTAVVHEAWLRLNRDRAASSLGEVGFLALAARVVRNVLVDHARARGAQKRGGDAARQRRSITIAAMGSDAVDTEALHEALEKLAARSERQARIIELRFFGGLEVAEVAALLRVSTDTVKRDWRIARAWLHRELQRGEEQP